MISLMRARVLPRLCFRGTARFSPPRKTSLGESARSRLLWLSRRTLAARIFNMPLKHNLVTRAIVICLFVSTIVSAEELFQAPAAIQIASTVSDGKYSLDEIARTARENGIKIIILGERDFMRWEYGLWPLRGLIKKTVESNSLFAYGIERYFKEIERLKKGNPDMLIIPGVESAPFYYWEGSPFRKNLKIKDWHKHMLIVGLKDNEDYENIPSLSNPRAKVEYDQYRGDPGPRPYQNLIDYVNQNNGLIYWAHPEAENISSRGDIRIETKEYSGDLTKTHGYTGFTVFYDGYEKTGRPGGLWDELLKGYCRGEGKSPVWAIGGLGFDQGGELSAAMKDLRVILNLSEWSQEAVLAALREGKNYVLLGRVDLRLENFSVENRFAPLIRIKGYAALDKEIPLRIKLIRQGAVIKTFEAGNIFDIVYEDPSYVKGEKTYYRLEIDCAGGMLIANPVFVGMG